MAGLKHNLEYIGARWVVFMAQVLSPRAADRFAAWLGTIMYHLLGSRRRVAFENIRSTIGKDYTVEQTYELVKKVFQNIARTIIEISRFEKIGIEGARKLVSGDKPAIVVKAHSEGKGCIAVTAHYGNWDLLGSNLVMMGYSMNALAATLHNQKVSDLINHQREALGLGVIPVESNLKSIFRILKKNGFVAMAIDQHAPAGIKINFLGRPALAAKGPALFAIRAGCPICTFLMRRESYDRHVLMPGELIYPPNSGDEEADIRTMTEACHKFFEEGIRQYPDQWMWTHKRWKVD